MLDAGAFKTSYWDGNTWMAILIVDSLCRVYFRNIEFLDAVFNYCMLAYSYSFIYSVLQCFLHWSLQSSHFSTEYLTCFKESKSALQIKSLPFSNNVREPVLLCLTQCLCSMVIPSRSATRDFWCRKELLVVKHLHWDKVCFYFCDLKKYGTVLFCCVSLFSSFPSSLN